MNERVEPPRDELITRVSELLKAERRRQASPRGSPEHREAEAEEERQRRQVWDLIERAPATRFAANERNGR